ncbi:Tetrathionate reductase subunit C [Arthrobacter sp. 9AX]|nr:Tetrathionate reductase subunit C [Arthrobacter sp. 9AX]
MPATWAVDGGAAAAWVAALADLPPSGWIAPEWVRVLPQAAGGARLFRALVVWLLNVGGPNLVVGAST